MLASHYMYLSEGAYAGMNKKLTKNIRLIVYGFVRPRETDP
jgi:hypothetical protein